MMQAGWGGGRSTPILYRLEKLWCAAADGQEGSDHSFESLPPTFACSCWMQAGRGGHIKHTSKSCPILQQQSREP
eukprot:scaffold194194_cov10-Tisochrysis_lutea.AAC.1